jgi:preprotein translocase subunit SecG
MVTYVFVGLQILAAIGLMVLTAITTTKSEQGSGFGWGTIGGKSSSTIAGLEDQLGRITTYVCVVFLIVSAVAAYLGVRAH